jgi:hypothetical protein
MSRLFAVVLLVLAVSLGSVGCDKSGGGGAKTGDPPSTPPPGPPASEGKKLPGGKTAGPGGATAPKAVE